jgi:biofilm PGA synthesis N-glycosyltransferase PgaC
VTMAAWIFLLALSGAIYILAGYPLLLRLLPQRSTSVRKDPSYIPTVTVLLAVYDGDAFLEERLNNLLSLDYPSEKLEIFVISDGSTDRTDEIAEGFEDRGVTLIRVPRGGKAAALNVGMARASGEILLFCDVRQRFDSRAIRELVANFADPKVGVVTGELKILKVDGMHGEQAAMDLYWRYEIWVRRIHSGIWSLFNTTGCIYAMRRSLARPLPPGTLGDDAALPLQAYTEGYRILFEPAAIAYDHPTQPGGEFRRRMRTLSGAWQVWSRYPRLLLPVHPMWLHFLSHKLGRLLLPWILLTVVIASLFLPESPWKWLILAGEAALFLAALVEPLLPLGLPFRRLFSVCRTFFSMNVAAMLATRVFFVSPQSMWSTPTKVDRVALPD